MKEIIRVGALMLAASTASTADAAIYRFTFDSEISTYLGAPFYYDVSGLEAPIIANLTVDIPSIKNADFDASFGGTLEEPFSYGVGTLLTASARSGRITSGINAIAFGWFRFKTDTIGDLVSINAVFAEDTPDFDFGIDRATWGDCCEDFYVAEGSWSVTRVPLPASAFFLLGAIGALGATRRLKSNHAKRLRET